MAFVPARSYAPFPSSVQSSSSSGAHLALLTSACNYWEEGTQRLSNMLSAPIATADMLRTKVISNRVWILNINTQPSFEMEDCCWKQHKTLRWHTSSIQSSRSRSCLVLHQGRGVQRGKCEKSDQVPRFFLQTFFITMTWKQSNALRKYRTISCYNTYQTLPYKYYYLLKVIPQTDLSFPVLNEENQQEGTEATLTLSCFTIGMSFHPSEIQLSTHPDRGMYSSAVNSTVFQQGQRLYATGEAEHGMGDRRQKTFLEKTVRGFFIVCTF